MRAFGDRARCSSANNMSLARVEKSDIPQKREKWSDSLGGGRPLGSRGSANSHEPRDGACDTTRTNSTPSLARRVRVCVSGAVAAERAKNAMVGDDGKKTNTRLSIQS